ncbi:hypothetical protein X797_005591 [Metarhizium robertsii]|uniref:Uncharacterized protein n=1 Tax=Metarhizium robertsii TaxID=568076 RepID=A0A014NGD9_9HYPO|nr:hypothetical protein X797_005591 [Metarhizium robertsii]
MAACEIGTMDVDMPTWAVLQGQCGFQNISWPAGGHHGQLQKKSETKLMPMPADSRLCRGWFFRARG